MVHFHQLGFVGPRGTEQSADFFFDQLTPVHCGCTPGFVGGCYELSWRTPINTQWKPCLLGSAAISNPFALIFLPQTNWTSTMYRSQSGFLAWSSGHGSEQQKFDISQIPRRLYMFFSHSPGKELQICIETSGHGFEDHHEARH